MRGKNDSVDAILEACSRTSLKTNTAQDQGYDVRGEPPPEALELKPERAGTVTRVLRSPRTEAANAHKKHDGNGQCIVCLQSLRYT